MKQVIKTIATLGLLPLLGSVSSVSADEAGFTINPNISYYRHDNELNLDDNITVGLGLGYQFNSRWGVELNYLEGSADIEGGSGDVDMTQIYLAALYHFNNYDGAVPYLMFGAGTQNMDAGAFDQDDSILTAGAGFKFDIANGLSLRTELRFINDLDEELSSFAFGLGLNWLVGGTSNAPAPAPVVKKEVKVLDGDQDGVPDDRDQCLDTSAGAKVDVNGCYVTLSATKEIQLNVVFENNSFVVSPASYGEIAAVVKFMTEYALSQVVLEGHTDDRGAAEYNQVLSQKRAQAVADLMVSKYGLDASRVQAKGFGESQPLTTNSTAEGRQVNRRVTAKVSAKVKTIQK